MIDIVTNNGNRYSYIRHSGEIVKGSVSDSQEWDYDSLHSFESMSNVEYYVICITEACNLRCTYCCYSGSYVDRRTHSSNAMQRGGIDDAYDFIQSFTSKRPITIAFYGGEPLTNYDVVQYAVMRGREIWEDDVRFSLSTNGVLLTPEKLEWLIEHKVKLCISIDGPKIINDRQRIDSLGIGSFAQVHNVLAYLNEEHCDYLKQDVALLMTLVSPEDIPVIAEQWNEDEVLRFLEPTRISSLAPNFAIGVSKADYEEVKLQCEQLLDLYVVHTDWVVLRKYLMQCIENWKNRPIMDAEDLMPMPTCLPTTNKLYIDSQGEIGVCEKISDKYRIGDVHNGIDWTKANELTKIFYDIRKDRCGNCFAVRMCNMCLVNVEFNEGQWDILCHNERVYNKLHFWLFCEMAERGLLK